MAARAGSERRFEVAALAARPRFCQKRAPEHVRNRKTDLCPGARLSPPRSRRRSLETGERLREADAGTSRLLVRVGRRECVDGTPVRHDGRHELVLRRLCEAKADGGACDALAVVDACTRFGALLVSALRCGKGARQEIDEREVLPDTPGIRWILFRLEMSAALFERGASGGQIAQAHVDFADGHERGALCGAAVPCPAFRQHAGQCVERRREVSLRHVYTGQAGERFRLAVRVRHAAEQLPAPAIVGDRCREVSQQIEHVPGADQGRRNGRPVRSLFLKRERLAISGQRHSVFSVAVADDRDAEERRSDRFAVLTFALDCQPLLGTDSRARGKLR